MAPRCEPCDGGSGVRREAGLPEGSELLMTSSYVRSVEEKKKRREGHVSATDAGAIGQIS